MNAMLTLVAAPCWQCGSTAETVIRDREITGKAGAVCCDPLKCWYCGADAPEPFMLGSKRFCCRACAADYAE
jgi:hypothetical protein